MRLLLLVTTIGALLAPLAASAQAPVGPRRSPRVLCGCPSARFLERAVREGAATVWLHDGAHVDTFVRDAAKPDRLVGSDAPPAVEELPMSGDAVPSSSRLVRVRAPAGFLGFLGILRPKEMLPKDVLDLGKPAAAEPSPPAPRLRALWLRPLEQREREGCGAYLTHQIAWEPVEGSRAELAALLVRDVGSNRSALVDVRFAGVYGLGRIDVCEQGLPLAPGAGATLEIRPVSSSLVVGEAWTFTSDGTGLIEPARGAVPPEADADRIADPFPVPGADDRSGPTFKMISVVVMGTVVGGAAVAALFAWVVIPLRRRRMKDIRCTACGSEIPVDTLDNKTDGFFCPSCGAAGFWKGKSGEAVDVHKL